MDMPNQHLPDAEELCQQVLETVGHEGPPTDLEAVCSLWPNLSLVEEDLDKEGYLVPVGAHAAEILVRRQDPVSRKRFTVAHELGHWVLRNQQNGRLLRGTSSLEGLVLTWNHKRQSPEETWCNRFAAALLVPRSDLHRHLCSGNIEQITIRATQGYSHFGVSQDAFLHRIAETTHLSLAEIVGGPKYRVRRTFRSKYGENRKLEVVFDLLVSYLENVGQRTEREISLGGFHVYSEIRGRSGKATIWACLIPEDGTLWPRTRYSSCDGY